MTACGHWCGGIERSALVALGARGGLRERPVHRQAGRRGRDVSNPRRRARRCGGRSPAPRRGRGPSRDERVRLDGPARRGRVRLRARDRDSRVCGGRCIGDRAVGKDPARHSHPVHEPGGRGAATCPRCLVGLDRERGMNSSMGAGLERLPRDY
jgi:hypothetical protein